MPLPLEEFQRSALLHALYDRRYELNSALLHLVSQIQQLLEEQGEKLLVRDTAFWHLTIQDGQLFRVWVRAAGGLEERFLQEASISAEAQAHYDRWVEIGDELYDLQERETFLLATLPSAWREK